MGVPGLQSFLRRRYASSFQESKPMLEHIYLDANAMLYQIAEVTKVPGDIARYLLDAASMYASEYKCICHIYIDGAAHMAKVREQRMRRFRYDPVTVTTDNPSLPGGRLGSVDTDNGLLFSPAMFSPGTKMMKDIHDYIDANIGNYNTIGTYSSYLEPGEGEHKIVDAIKALPKGTRVGIVGKDADLLLISMLLVEQGYTAYVIRHNDTPRGKPDGYLPNDPLWNVNCIILRNLILKDINGTTIWKFILGTLPMGNDFIPGVPEMIDQTDRSRLDDIYKVLPGAKDMYDIDSNKITWSELVSYLYDLYQVRGTGNLHSTLYYKKMSPFPIQVDMLLREWILAVEWVHVYYLSGISVASIAWQYPTHYSPSLEWLSQMNVTTDMENHICTESRLQHKVLLPEQALMAVLPPWLWNLLPEQSRNTPSKYPQYYPYGYSLIEGTGLPYIPIIPYSVVSTM